MAAGGIVHTWKIKDAIDLKRWNVHASGAGSDAIAISDDGDRIALGDATGVLHILDAENYRELAELPAHLRWHGNLIKLITSWRERDGLFRSVPPDRLFAPAG